MQKSGDDDSNASNDATDTITSVTASGTGATARSGDTYIYSVGINAVLAIGIYVFLRITRNLLRPLIKNKRRNWQGTWCKLCQSDVICFRYDDEKALYKNEYF